MRHLASLWLLFLVSLTPIYSSIADEIPKRKPGLWEVSVTSDGVTRVSKQCIDEKTDAQLQQMGSQIGQGCKKQEVRKEGQSYVSEAECSMAGSMIRAKTIFTGDFTSNYKGDVLSTYDPPLFGKKDGQTSIAARWVGPCEPGQQPGDILTPDGAKMNVKALTKMIEGK